MFGVIVNKWLAIVLMAAITLNGVLQHLNFFVSLLVGLTLAAISLIVVDQFKEQHHENDHSGT